MAKIDPTIVADAGKLRSQLSALTGKMVVDREVDPEAHAVLCLATMVLDEFSYGRNMPPETIKEWISYWRLG